MKVRATRTGYYGHKRRREGEVFDLNPVKNKKGTVIPAEAQFSDVWMEKVDASTKSKKPESKMAKESESDESDVI